MPAAATSIEPIRPKASMAKDSPANPGNGGCPISAAWLPYRPATDEVKGIPPMPRSTADLATLRPDRVCLIKPSSLGDVVHALPVLSALRTLWPQAHLAWVVNRGLRGLLDGHPQLDEVIAFDRASVGLGPRGLAAFLRFAADLRRRRFDLAIDLQGLFRSGVMTAATGAKVRVGLSTAREGAAHFYTHRIEAKPEALPRGRQVDGCCSRLRSRPSPALPRRSSRPTTGRGPRESSSRSPRRDWC